MIEASGIGWQGRYEQAELVARVPAAARATRPDRGRGFERPGRDGPRPDLTGGYHYLGLERMAYYVNKDAYRRAVRDARSSALRGLHAVTPLADRQAPTLNIDDVVLDFNRRR